MTVESRGPLVDYVVLALIVAHGADSEFDPRESKAVLDSLRELSHKTASGSDVIALIKTGALAYQNLKVGEVDEVVRRLASSMDLEERRRTFAALAGVAAADGVQHPMESTILRHIGLAWNLHSEEKPPPMATRSAATTG